MAAIEIESKIRITKSQLVRYTVEEHLLSGAFAASKHLVGSNYFSLNDVLDYLDETTQFATVVTLRGQGPLMRQLLEGMAFWVFSNSEQYDVLTEALTTEGTQEHRQHSRFVNARLKHR